MLESGEIQDQGMNDHDDLQPSIQEQPADLEQDNPIDDQELIDILSKDGISSRDVKLLGFNLGMFNILERLMLDNAEGGPIMQAMALFDAWKKSQRKKENDREVFVAALGKSGRTRTGRSLSKDGRRRADTIVGEALSQIQNQKKFQYLLQESVIKAQYF